MNNKNTNKTTHKTQIKETMNFSSLFHFAGAKIAELNNLVAKDAWVSYVKDLVRMADYAMHCGFIEDYLRRIIQSGVTHEVKKRLIGLESQQFVDCLFVNAKSVTIQSQTAFVDSCFVQEKIQKAEFDESHMPELKTQNWWTKDYKVSKVVGSGKILLEETFKVKITKLTFRYNQQSKELMLSLKFKCFKWVTLDGKSGWTEVA